MKILLRSVVLGVSVTCLSAPAFSQQPGKTQAKFCQLANGDLQSPLKLDEIKDVFNATGYISAHVCFPGPRPTRDQNQGENGKQLAGYYTRWIIEPAQNADFDSGQRLYSAEGRKWYQRLFTDRVIDTAHFLEITMAAPNVKFSIPLSNFKYNEEGENGIEYTTAFRQHAFNQTFFRVDTNTTSNLVARARHSFKTSFSGFSEALDAVQNVINLVAPTSTLLTSINAEQVSNTSTAIDTVASSLFSNSYDETVEDGFTLADWYADRKVLIVVQFPFEVTSHKRNENRRSNNETAIYKAYWLSLACPRQSMFSTEDICNKGKRVTATIRSVLNFEMAANTTVQQHLAAQQWYKDFLTSPVLSEEKSADNTDARQDQIVALCRNIDNEFYSAGFNDRDAKLIKYSAIDGMSELSKVSDEIFITCQSKEDDQTFFDTNKTFIQ